METSAHIEHFRADSAALLAAHAADPHAAVPSCPGWDRTDLLAHTGDVHARNRAQLELGPSKRARRSAVEPPPEGPELARWYEEGAAALLRALETMDLTATWPTWAGPQPGTFFPRRMAQEMTVHRWDGAGGEIDAALAVDGVDELLELFAPRIPAEKITAEGTLHLHATDDALAAPGEWLIQLGPDGISWERLHAKGDVALRGSAGDLLLWAWNRVPVDERFEVFGDRSLLDAWRSTVAF